VPGALVAILSDGLPYNDLKADSNGNFKLQLPVGSYSVKATMDAYESTETTFYLQSSTSEYALKVSLNPIALYVGSGRKLTGALAEGSTGDILMQNQKLSMMVAVNFKDSQLPNVTMGNPIDLAAQGVTDGIDWMIFPYLSATRPDRPTNAWKIYTVQNQSVRVVENTPQRAVVEANGIYTQNPDVTLRTTFTLRPGEEWVHAVTRISNSGQQPVTVWAGDIMDNDDGTQVAFVPGTGDITTTTPRNYTPTQPWVAQYGDAPQAHAFVYDDSFAGFTQTL
jgi:hypothetical protein